MTTAVEYRLQAAPLGAQGRAERHAGVRQEFLQLSKLYLRLAEQADKNSQLDITYEPPPRLSPAARRSSSIRYRRRILDPVGPIGPCRPDCPPYRRGRAKPAPFPTDARVSPGRSSAEPT